jgi:REP element-mobilizing transposase RayT
MARGNARERIHWDDEDRLRFLEGLSRVCGRFGWILWAYCLMDNHYHLLVETEQPTLSRGMREVNDTYSRKARGQVLFCHMRRRSVGACLGLSALSLRVPAIT